MHRRPPISKRTDTRVPYTTLVRSQRRGDVAAARAPLVAVEAVAQRLQLGAELPVHIGGEARPRGIIMFGGAMQRDRAHLRRILGDAGEPVRSEEHTSELQSLMRISYAVFCLKKKNIDIATQD